MSEIKLLHIADLHFDRKISHLTPRKCQIRRSEILLSFSSILTRFNDAEIVLISGDLFDGICDESTINYFCNLLEKHNKKRFFLSCGNHDCLSSVTIDKLMEIKPDNLWIFGDSLECVEVDELSLRVYGISFSESGSYTSLIDGFCAEDDDYLNLMTLHADVGGDSQYNPVSFSDIERSNLDYLALGHVHSFSGFQKRGKTCYAYPGVHEPAGFDETGHCGVIYGTVSKGDISLEFFPTSKREYITLDIDVSDYLTNEDLVTGLLDSINTDNLYRINFVGTKNFNIRMDTYAELINCFYIEFNDNTKSNDSILNYKNELSLRGKSAAHLLKSKDVCREDVFNMACDILTDIMCR